MKGLRYFEALSIFLSTQNYVILETTRNEKKNVKKAKTTINAMFSLCPRSIILTL